MTWRFPETVDSPRAGWLISWRILSTRMMTGGSPVLGKLQKLVKSHGSPSRGWSIYASKLHNFLLLVLGVLLGESGVIPTAWNHPQIQSFSLQNMGVQSPESTRNGNEMGFWTWLKKRIFRYIQNFTLGKPRVEWTFESTLIWRRLRWSFLWSEWSGEVKMPNGRFCL